MKIFVSGGTGFIGSYLVRRLLADGHDVLALVRSLKAVEKIRELGAEPVEGDLSVPGQWQDSVGECDSVVHCAAMVGDWGSKIEFWNVNVEGTRHMVEAAAGKVDRFVHISSIAAHRGQGLRNESTQAIRGGHPYSDTKAAAEEVVEGAVEEGLNAQLVRVANVYGPGDPHVLPRILEQVSRGSFVIVGDGSQPSSMIYIDDVVDAISAILMTDCEPGERFLVTDQNAPAIREAIQIAFGALDIEPKIIRLPKWLAMLVAALSHAFAFITGKRPMLTFYAVYSVSNVRTLVNDLTMERLLWSPKVDFREGVKRTVSWWKETAG